MYELKSNDNSAMDHWEKVCKNRWGFIVGHTRKGELLRVLATKEDFDNLVEEAFEGLNKTEPLYEKIESVKIKIVPESEWLLPEEKNC